MAEHPIQDLMKTAMESIKGMVDVNIVVGDTVETPDGTVIIPISKVSFGFAAGGSDHNAGTKTRESGANESASYPFGGGSGAGVTVKPVGFLICGKDSGIRFMSVENNSSSDRIMEMIPWAVDKIGQFLDKNAAKENKHQPKSVEKPSEKENDEGL